jgi:hypothetical protein
MVEDFKPIFDLEILELEGFEQPDIPRLIDHPLLASNNGRLCFSYYFLPPYLRAMHLNN